LLFGIEWLGSGRTSESRDRARVTTSDTSIDPLPAVGSCPRPPAAHFSRAVAKAPISLHRAALVEALKGTARGDRAAFEKVYAATAAKLFGIVVRILGRRDLAEDVMQDVYVRVWQRAGDFNPETGSPITWLATIARNRALDETRRKTTRSLEDCPEVFELPSEDDPRIDQERSEQRSRLQACLDGLASEKRQLVMLAYVYGMTREELALRTGQPVATVKTWLRRSLAQLKDCLGHA
jgi:RNA polymerase sigma-70 factor (ECF subfamily)